jgi:hypothetical protein
MGDGNNNGGGGGGRLKEEEIVLLLFTLFGILVVGFLLLIVVVFQTWALWKIAKVVVEQNTEGDGGRRRSEGTWLGGGTLIGSEEAGAGAKERFE